MKKKKFTGKLSLNKETISKLQDGQMSNIEGGGTNNSTNRTFTCCWCSSETADGPACPSHECSTYGPNPSTCPPNFPPTG